ncbi:TonB-dependent siderophore receptor [Variovorax sp. H27-G14]|uniref:TonB-dependent siderophore receptor n=1 Tax=Variovorax sp. H27-G14 TaxID=3111914 RepID=UPI0038FC6A83
MAFAQASGQAVAQVFDVKVPSQALGAALNEFSRQTGVQVFAAGDVVAGTSSRAVQGKLTLDQALRQMLAGTTLEATRTGNGGFAVRRAADIPGSQSTLPAVQVVANADESPTGPVTGYVARRSVTATKTDTPVLEVPQSISIIGRDEMEARGAQDIMDAIRYTPGVTTSMYGPDNRGWEDILLRGFNTYNSSYRDGLAQTPFSVNYYITEPYALERVEVLRGPSSMVFGRGDAGGIINRVSKQPTGEPIREIEVQYGSFQRKQLAFDLGDRIGNTDLSYRLVGVSLDSNDQDRYSDGQKLNRTRAYLAPSVRWQPNADTSLTVFGEFLKNRSGEDPYYINANGRFTNVKMGDPSFSGIKQEQASLGYRFETKLAPEWTLRQSFRYTTIALDRRVVWADSVAEDERTIYRIARTWNDPLKQSVLDTNVQGKVRAGITEHTLLFGVDWNELKGKSRQFRGAAPDLDLYAPVYNQLVTPPTEATQNYRQTTRQIGIYAQDQIKIDDKWVVTLGGRQDRVTSITNDTLNTSYTKNRDDAFSGRAGLTYLVGNGWAPYLSYTESFLPNSGLDGNNEPFKPSRGKQVEVGLKYQPEGTRTSFTAAVFDLRKTNVVTYDPVTFEGRQIGKQRSRGLELEAKGELAPGLNIAASYTWLDMKVLNSADPDELGKIPPLVPKQSASVWLDYTLGNGLGFGGGVRYVGKRQNDEHNTSYERGVTVADAAVHYETGPWRLALNVTNLFNKKYFSICYHGECYRGNERAVTMTARYKF